jgi:predicted ATPase
MFTGMRAQNFKSWQDTGEIRLAPLTGFFGPNSSGKTSLLQILLVWKQTVESADLNQILLTDGAYINLGNFYDLIYQHEPSNELGFSFSYNPSAKDLEDLFVERSPLFHKAKKSPHYFQFQIAIEAYQKNVQVREFKHSINFSGDSVGIGMRRNVAASNGSGTYELVTEGHSYQQSRSNLTRLNPVKSYGFPYVANDLYNDASALVLALENTFKYIYYLGPLRENLRRIYLWTGEEPHGVGNRGEWAIPALITAHVTGRVDDLVRGELNFQLHKKVADWLQKLGLIYRFRLQPIAEGRREYEVLVQTHPDAAEVLITDVGFGVSQVLPVLALCYYAPLEATIILEQPELHLHPAVQAGLADVFIDAIKTRNIQIILESHSEHLLRRLQRRIAEEELNREDTALYFVSMADGTSRLEGLDLDTYGNIRNWPANFFGDEMGDLVAMTEAAMKRKIAEKQA